MCVCCVIWRREECAPQQQLQQQQQLRACVEIQFSGPCVFLSFSPYPPPYPQARDFCTDKYKQFNKVFRKLLPNGLEIGGIPETQTPAESTKREEGGVSIIRERMAVAGSGSVAEESAALFASSSHQVTGGGGGAVGGSGATGGENGESANNSDCGSTGVGVGGGPSGWSEFCERHARAAASDFAKSCVHYINKNLPENVRATVSHREFMVRFVECFSDHFDSEFSRRRSYSKVRIFGICGEIYKYRFSKMYRKYSPPTD